eukprot:GILI01001380.1.p1 GENE.GILI01001380.1~~GILI01001380.1.p1  ORF type:complete len:586 (+),score=197.11 GILI01001380.1:169-1926(+)
MGNEDGEMALGLLREDLMAAEDVAEKVAVVQKTKTVAILCGPELTRNELIPTLKNLTNEADEVLMTVAAELGMLRDYVGGPQYAYLLLEPLEIIASIEETVVREKAVDSINLVAAVLPDPHVPEYLVPLVLRLAAADWFTSRVSACGLYPSAYVKAGAQRLQLRTSFLQLCVEETPMVKRAAATKLAAFAEKVEREVLASEILPVIKTLATDDQEAVRVSLVECVIQVSKLLSGEEVRVHLLGLVARATEEKNSWRVRLAVAKNFSDLGEALGAQFTSSSAVLPLLTQLLTDVEPEVRVSALKSLCTMVQSRGLELAPFAEQVLPLLAGLSTDSSQLVRCGVAELLECVSIFCGREHTLRTILPLLSALMLDEHHQVRCIVTNSLSGIVNVGGSELLNGQAFLQSLHQLAADSQWRVRQALFHQLPLFATHVGVEGFVSKLDPLLMQALTDSVHSVRLSSITVLKDLVSALGSDWCVAHLLPRVVEHFFKDHSYLHRMTSLLALPALIAGVPTDRFIEQVVPVLRSAAKDQVPNIRFALSKTLKEVLADVDPTLLQTHIKPLLVDLCSDSDKDVQYYANEALKLC